MKSSSTDLKFYSANLISMINLGWMNRDACRQGESTVFLSSLLSEPLAMQYLLVLIVYYFTNH